MQLEFGNNIYKIVYSTFIIIQQRSKLIGNRAQHKFIKSSPLSELMMIGKCSSLPYGDSLLNIVSD